MKAPVKERGLQGLTRSSRRAPRSGRRLKIMLQRFADAEIQAQQWVEAAEALAMDTLRANRDLFLLCLAALKKKGSLGIQELEELFRNIVPTGNY